MHEPGIALRKRFLIFALLLLHASAQGAQPEGRFISGVFPACQDSGPEKTIPQDSPPFHDILPEGSFSPGSKDSPPFHCILPEGSFSPAVPAEISSADSGMLPGSSREKFRIVFYNVENLFDTINEPGKNDDAFTPGGDRRWTEYRLRHKINNIYRAIAAASGLEIPAMIGLCEVENLYVLERLARETGLKNHDYGIIHRNSADSRGIDVALLYRPGIFRVLDTMFRSIPFPFDSLPATRDILYVKGIVADADTLHVFVNHWMSRWRGQAVSEPYRNYTAAFLKSLTDSIFGVCRRSNIVVMGDFNDEPQDASLRDHLVAATSSIDPLPGMLYNLSYGKAPVPGTLKYQGQWFLFDQFIVSGSLLDGRGRLKTSRDSFRIFHAGFLLVPDERWFGYKPFRSYEGFRYTGGFSDHLPVVLDLWW